MMKFSKIIFILLVILINIEVSGQKKVKNIIVILADDHALKVTGCYGNEIIRTPTIDKLANEGVMFTGAYCNAPICSASRQSLLTGKYPHSTGVNLLFTPFPDYGNVTIAEHLHEFGYKSAIIGKTHFNNWILGSVYKEGMPTHGFDISIEGGDYAKFLKENPMPELPKGIETFDRNKAKDVPTEWMNTRCLPQPFYDDYSEGTFYAKQAIQFIEENKDKPFFLWLAFKEPHHPYFFPIEYRNKYNPEDMPLPKGSPEDDRWVPAKYKNLTKEQRQGIVASYYTSTEYLDKNIGLVLDAVKSNKMEDNTLVIYISDNGYLLNEHKRFEKHTLWEEAVRQPMIVSMPDNKQNGKKIDALVEYIDVVPSILELTGNMSLKDAQGKSFSQVLYGEKEKHRDYVFSEYLQDNMAMVADENYKYIFYTGSRDLNLGYATGYGPSGITHRLYDLKNDPTEGHSLAKESAHKDKLKKMQQLMLDHFMKTHPDADKCPSELSLEGKLVWFCEPRDVGADQHLEAIPIRVFQGE